MGVTGKEFTIAKNDGVQSYGNIVQLVESPKTAGVLYAGTDDGKVHMTKDGKTWTDITGRFPGVPKNAYVSRLTRLRARRQRRLCDLRQSPRRRHTARMSTPASTAATTSARSAKGIPKGHAVMSLAEDPKNPNVLYRAPSSACSSARIAAASGRASSPTCRPCRSTRSSFHPRDNDMIVATHGRSIWILDDIDAAAAAARKR